MIIIVAISEEMLENKLFGEIKLAFMRYFGQNVISCSTFKGKNIDFISLSMAFSNNISKR